jgi:hypothetical protein
MSENSGTHDVTVAQPQALTEFAMTPQQVLKQAQLVQQVMRDVMKDTEHYGVIPGCGGKKSLFKPGAEKLCFVFGLSNRLHKEVTELPGGHREYSITCDLYDRAGNLRGQGVGCCSTMESKYRYRGAAGKECPSCGAMAMRPGKKEYGGGYYCDRKSGGCGASCKGGTKEAKALDRVPSVRAENPDPADQYNTVLKMAKKRALVDAVLTATAASDIFAQDLEDLEDRIHDEPVIPVAAPVPAATGEIVEQSAAPDPIVSRTTVKDTVTEREAKYEAAPDVVGETTVDQAITKARAWWGKLKEAGHNGEEAEKVVVALCSIYGCKKPGELTETDAMSFLEDMSALIHCTDLEDIYEYIRERESEGSAA